MSLTFDEKVTWFKRNGVSYVFENEKDEFIKAISLLGLSYEAYWDEGFRCYAFYEKDGPK